MQPQLLVKASPKLGFRRVYGTAEIRSCSRGVLGCSPARSNFSMGLMWLGPRVGGDVGEELGCFILVFLLHRDGYQLFVPGIPSLEAAFI